MMQNKFDLIVVGGGPAGAAAAISAARLGTKVLLIERNNCLGGAAANALVSPFMNYWTVMPDGEEKKFLCGNLFLEIVSEMQKVDPIHQFDRRFDDEVFKLVLGRMAIDAGVTLLYNAQVISADVTDGNITGVDVFARAKTLHFTADFFIDATGDGELSTLAGCDFVVGRQSDGLCQPMTLCFRMSGVDKQKYRENKPKINPLYAEHQAKGLIKNPRENVLIFDNFNDGVLHFNTTRIIKKDPTDPFDVTQAEIEAREQAFEVLRFLKENIEGFENARILSTALQIGIRESRKIIGDYVLTQEDLISLARFEDAIAVSNYAIDIHNPAGTGTTLHYFGKGEWYEIPYRCLVPKGKDNLLVAGRCISSTHEAQASYRIIPFCAQLGQAAGTAASLAVKNQTTSRDVDIKQLQTILRAEGFVI